MIDRTPVSSGRRGVRKVRSKSGYRRLHAALVGRERREHALRDVQRGLPRNDRATARQR